MEEKIVEKNNENSPWWKPAIVFYAKATSWILIPLLVFLFVGKYLSNSTGHQIFFLVCLMVSFGISCFGIYREIKIYQKNLDKK